MWYFSLTPWSLAQTDRRHINRHVKRTCPFSRQTRPPSSRLTSHATENLLPLCVPISSSVAVMAVGRPRPKLHHQRLPDARAHWRDVVKVLRPKQYGIPSAECMLNGFCPFGARRPSEERPTCHLARLGKQHLDGLWPSVRRPRDTCAARSSAPTVGSRRRLAAPSGPPGASC